MKGNLNTRPLRTYTILPLLALACIVAFLAFVHRPDSFEEMDGGITNCWIILGPLWAIVAFLAGCQYLAPSRYRVVVAICSAVIVWLSVGSMFSSWEKEKVRMRLGPKFPQYYEKYKSGN